MKRTLVRAACLLVFLGVSAGIGRADMITWSTGDLGNNVIYDGGIFTVNPDLINPSNVDAATLVVKYGLWNSPDVPVDVTLNGTPVGSFTADHGYISPGPEYATIDVTGLLQNGLNTLVFTGSGDGDYVIGQVDLTYNSLAAVPEPSTLAIASASAVAGLLIARRRKRS